MRRGVPRSPNHYLNELGMFRQVEVGWRQVQADRFLNIQARFHLRFTGRSAAW